MADNLISKGHPVYYLYRGMWIGLDWLFPPHCGGCGERGARLCQICLAKITRLLPPVCMKCGASFQPGGLCPRCVTQFPVYTALRSYAGYTGPIRNAISRLKYQGDIALGDVLAQPLIEALDGLGWSFDLVIPTPIGPSRKKERGYNQAALLARPIALFFGKVFAPQALKKVRDTRTQVGLTYEQRWENVQDAFVADRKMVRDKQVLLVDDVTTSGATLNFCAQALIDAGAGKTYCLTLARAI